MAEPSTPKPEPYAGGGGGFVAHFSEMLAAVLAYLQARFQLAGLESKEAAVHYAMLVAWVGGALGLVIFGYIFFVIGLVFGIAWLFHSPGKWFWVLLGVGVFHMLAAVFCVLMARAKLFVPMFRETLGELKKDQVWLSSQKLSKKPN